jgi:hypothetical protein
LSGRELARHADVRITWPAWSAASPVITTRSDGREVALVWTDENWKWSEKAPEGWARPEFDDQS